MIALELALEKFLGGRLLGSVCPEGAPESHYCRPEAKASSVCLTGLGQNLRLVPQDPAHDLSGAPPFTPIIEAERAAPNLLTCLAYQSTKRMKSR
jgi:hypothetical protein